jgi:hypothetical protein
MARTPVLVKSCTLSFSRGLVNSNPRTGILGSSQAGSLALEVHAGRKSFRSLGSTRGTEKRMVGTRRLELLTSTVSKSTIKQFNNLQAIFERFFDRNSGKMSLPLFLLSGGWLNADTTLSCLPLWSRREWSPSQKPEQPQVFAVIESPQHRSSSSGGTT